MRRPRSMWIRSRCCEAGPAEGRLYNGSNSTNDVVAAVNNADGRGSARKRHTAMPRSTHSSGAIRSRRMRAVIVTLLIISCFIASCFVTLALGVCRNSSRRPSFLVLVEDGALYLGYSAPGFEQFYFPGYCSIQLPRAIQYRPELDFVPRSRAKVTVPLIYPALGFLFWTHLWYTRSRCNSINGCHSCGYDISRLTGGRCPECGAPQRTNATE